ncbi:subclass B3 metallo-beta-lactamase [Massilia sp. DWR3-1-1]|uniref:subclass B3 metallo-beta-lactamase n=1 Tax=Massilia sp. DWR3-1-1 TaxID=2804559 RepID=UPI003CE76057
MTAIRLALAGALLAGAASAHADDWNDPQEPFAIYGNTYYVGVRGLSAVLITSPDGHILIDGGSPDSPAQIAAHIGQLGFKVEDIKYILNSHEHFDHAGGIAALQAWSGATVLSSRRGATVLRSGRPNRADPQYSARTPAMAAMPRVRALDDGQVLSLGELRVTAHYTPGHAPGGVSWTWQSREGERSANMVYADSISAYAAKPFRYSGSARYPQARAQLERSIGVIAALPCDILISAHPEVGELWTRKARADSEGNGAFIDPAGCRAYAAKGQARLSTLLAEEAQAK